MRLCTELFVAALLTLVLGTSALAWGVVCQADSNLNVRKGRSATAEHVLTLQKGEQVRTDFLQNGWVAVFRLDVVKRVESKAVGYAKASYLKPVKANTPGSAAVQTKGMGKSASPSARLASQPVTIEKGTSGVGQVKSPVASAPQNAPQGAASESVPVSITAERMTYDEKRKLVSFVGNVIAKHEGLTLWADTLSAYFLSTGSKKIQADSIDRIVAKGNVRAKKEKTTGTCGKLTYRVEKRILVMEDKPVLKDGPNSITGEVIRYYVRENRSEVVGGKKGKRVEAIFFAPKGMKVQ